MLRRDLAIDGHEVDIGLIVGSHDLEWSPAGGPRQIQHLGKEGRRFLAVMRRHDRVVEIHCHHGTSDPGQTGVAANGSPFWRIRSPTRLIDKARTNTLKMKASRPWSSTTRRMT